MSEHSKLIDELASNLAKARDKRESYRMRNVYGITETERAILYADSRIAENEFWQAKNALDDAVNREYPRGYAK